MTECNRRKCRVGLKLRIQADSLKIKRIILHITILVLFLCVHAKKFDDNTMRRRLQLENHVPF